MENHRRIMLVEDDFTMRTLLTTLLKLEKHTVIHPQDLQEADILTAIDEQHPEVIIMDVSLKSINGLDILSKIRSMPQYQSIKILMASGYDLDLECRDAGADGFILKPYMPSDILDWLAKA